MELITKSSLYGCDMSDDDFRPCDVIISLFQTIFNFVSENVRPSYGILTGVL